MFHKNFPTEVPRQLSGLETIYKQAAYPNDIDEAEYAGIAFKLAELSMGKNKEKNLEAITTYIQNQHASMKRVNNNYSDLLDKIMNWMGWAVIWTRHKDDKPEA